MINNYWSEKEVSILKKLYSNVPNKELGKLLNRSSFAVREKAYTYGLHKHLSYSIGDRNGRMVIIEILNREQRNIKVRCICDCGTEKIVFASSFKQNISCGCFQIERTKETHITHGKSKTIEYGMLGSAKERAKKLNLEFDLDINDILIPELCPVFNIPLIKGIKHQTPNSPSLDRINPNIGYIKTNVKIISNKANSLKQDSTLEILEKIYNYINNSTPNTIIPSIDLLKYTQRIYHGKSKTDEYRMWLKAKCRARNSKLNFNIEITDIKIPDTCQILEIPLFFTKNVRTCNTPALDRINVNYGYVKGNISVISDYANRMKQNVTLAELEKIINYVKINSDNY